MAFRSDILIDWNVSPRKITIGSPSTNCSMQDLYDTLRTLESKAGNLDNQSIVSGSGKVVLDDDGNAVGLTLQLINAVVGFEARPGPDWVQCFLDGGNLSGLEADESTVTTLVTHNTAFVNINKTSSVSATISENVISESLDYNGILHYDTNNTLNGRGIGQEHPVGTTTNPVNNISDGLAISLKYGLKEVYAYSNVDMDRDVNGFKVVGAIPGLTFNPNGFKAHLCQFESLKIDGDFNDSLVKIKDCNVLNALNVYGSINNSYHSGLIRISGGQNLNMADCESGIAGFDSPEVDMNQGQDTTFSSRSFSGGQTITNCDTPNSKATLSFIGGGKPHLEPSCTDGLISVRGQGYLDDRSDGTTIDLTAWFNSYTTDQIITTIKDILEGDMIPEVDRFRILNKVTKAILVDKTASQVDGLTQLTE